MGLNNFSGQEDEGSSGPTKTTYYQFENPDHPDSKEFDEPDRARRHFNAAQYVQQKLGTDRHNLVGEFLVAVQELDEENSKERLEALVTRLAE